MNNGLKVTQTSYELTKAAQQINIEVKANVKFSVEVDSGCKDWVKYNTTKGLTTSTVVLDIAENKTYDSREGKVTIKQDGGSLSSTVTIKQSQLDGLFLTTSEYNLSNEKHTLTVEVSTNVEFDVKPEADWVKYVQTKGLSTKQIVLEVAENDTYTQRETEVKVKQKNGDLSGTITIKQDEKYGILVSQSEYNLTNEAQTIDVEVKYNVDFEVSIPDGCKNWIKQVSTKGLNTKNYTFSVAKNETYGNREGSITFKQKKGSLSGTAAIKQAQTDYLEVAKNEYTVDIEGETITIEVTSNVDYTVSISEDAQSWLSQVGTKGLSKDNVQIAVAAGDDNTDRKGEIVISYRDMKRSIKVHQYSYAANTIIQFADEKVKAKLVEAFDKNRDGELSIKEAKDVKSIEGVFGAIKTYKSFDEFRYFTGVTDIPEGMFSEWNLMTSIILPETIKTISAQAFYKCVKLSSITIPESVTHIYKGAFEGAGLKRVEISNLSAWFRIRFEDFGAQPLKNAHHLFINGEELTSLIIPNEITDIGDFLFAGCTCLSSVVLHDKVKSIGWGTFSRCTGLTSINIPESVTSIWGSAFYCCENLSIEIPESVVEYGIDALYGVGGPIQIAYSYSGRSLSGIIDRPSSVHLIIPKSVSTTSYYENCNLLKSVVITEGVTEICQGAFRKCSNLSSVVIPESVTKIGEYAFEDCTSLSSVVIPESVSMISSASFAHCTNLSSVIIPESVTKIGEYAFEDCTSLSSVIIPESVTTIGEYAFAHCTNLSSVIIPESVSEIKQSAFYGCTNLTVIMKSETPPFVDVNSFAGVMAIFVPKNSLETYIKSYCYYKYASIIQAMP